MKRIVAFSVALGLMLGASAFVGEAQAAKVIKIAGMKADKEPETLGMKKFGELLEKKSNGFYKVKVYPNSSLGKEDKYIADNRRGTIEMCATGTQDSAFHPADGFVEKSGLRCLNMFPLGFRHFYTKKPVATIDDIKGLKLRVPNITLYTTFAKECGINGQAMPFAEVMSSVDQGVIDGGDSPLADITSTKVYEKCPNITLTGHILVIHSLFINEKLYQKMPAEHKQWVQEAAAESADYVWKLVEEVDAKSAEEIKANGGTISEPSQAMKDHMVAAAKRTWTMFTDPERKVSYVPNAQEIFDKAASFK